tara:strand:- start:162 stop:947 length:786 start_codon:yes stop_codon:yes gene_type:complete
MSSAHQIADAVLLRRQHRSLIENGPPAPAWTHRLWLSWQRVDYVVAGEYSDDSDDSEGGSLRDLGRGHEARHVILSVMMKDGSKRPARDIYEWLQQYCVEQCAVLLALKEQLPKGAMPVDLPCQLGNADGYKAPQVLMGCASWWTEHGKGQVFDRLVHEWRRTERTAAIVLDKVHPEGNVLFDLIQPFLKLPPMATHFPCTRENLGSFIEEISCGEYPSHYHKDSDSLELFTETDFEDGLQGGYFLSQARMQLTPPDDLDY